MIDLYTYTVYHLLVKNNKVEGKKGFKEMVGLLTFSPWKWGWGGIRGGVNRGFTAIIYYTRYFGRYFLQEAPYCFLLTMFHDTA